MECATPGEMYSLCVHAAHVLYTVEAQLLKIFLLQVRTDILTFPNNTVGTPVRLKSKLLSVAPGWVPGEFKPFSKFLESG